MPRTTSYDDAVVLAHRTGDGMPVVVVAGALGLGSVGRLRDAVLHLSASTPSALCLDLSRATEVDSVGLRTLVACRRLAAAAGAELVLLNPSAVLSARLRATGLAPFFSVHEQASRLSSEPITSWAASAGQGQRRSTGPVFVCR